MTTDIPRSEPTLQRRSTPADIGHPRRREIVPLLSGGDKAAGGLVDERSAFQSTVPEHLSHLRGRGCRDRAPRGRERLYHLQRASLQQVCA